MMCVTPVAAKYFQFSITDSHSSAQLSNEIAPVWMNYSGAAPIVPQFSKIEMGFHLPLVVESAVEQFLKTGKGLNPFDPEAINVEVVYTNGNLSYTSYGFYYEVFERDAATIVPVFDNCPQAKWKKASTLYKWRARFAPPVQGVWTAVVNVYLGDVTSVAYSSAPIRFQCIKEMSSKGFLEVGADKRHFRFSGTKESFFALGQDIAWPDGERFRGGANAVYPNLLAGGYMDVQDWTQNLAQNGGNMIRVVNVPWSYELEWDTVGVYNMAHAWELDSLFAVCESNRVQMVFCLEHGTYSLPSWYEEHLTWAKHPYHKYIPGVEMPEDFLTDSVARKQYRKKLHYFLARWGYSSSLGIVQLISEMVLWKFSGRETDLKYKIPVQRKFLAWHDEMGAYVKQQVLYRPLLTSTSYGAPPRDFKVNAFDSEFIDVVAPRHCYFTERNDNLRRWEEMNGGGKFEKGILQLYPSKPGIIDETGFGSYVGDPNDIDACNDITYHNTLWATSFMGTAGSALYWWRWGSDDYRAKNFPALAVFFHGLDFEKTWYTRPGHWEDASRTSKVKIETFYLTSAEDARWNCIGWVHNASYWWGNISQNCKDRNGKSTGISSKTGDDVALTSPQELPEGTYFDVHDLAPQKRYRIVWYNTRNGGGLAASNAGEADIVKTNIFGTAKIPWKKGAADWAYKMVKVD